MIETDKLKKQMEKEERLAKYVGDDEVISSLKLKDHLSETFKAKKSLSLKSGIEGIDNLIVSFEGGELTTISGPTGNGKTLCAQTLTAAFSAQERNCLWFTYEVPAYQFLRQFGADIPYFFMPKMLSGNSMTWIEDKIIEAKCKYGLDVVFVDHLHFLVDMNSRNNMSLEIGNIMRQLKKIAIKHNISFFLLAHTAKAKPDEELDNNSIRDSSFVAQESDNVFFIWRVFSNGEAGDRAVLKITKNRRMGIMNAKVNLKKDGCYLIQRYD